MAHNRLRAAVAFAITLPAFLLLAASAAGADESATYLDRTIIVKTDPRFCAVGQEDPADRRIRHAYDGASGDAVSVVSIQADCTMLDKYRRGEVAMGDVVPSMAVQVNLKGGKPMIFDLPRAQFLDRIEAGLTGEGSEQVYALTQDSARSAMVRMKQSMGPDAGNIELDNTQILGVLGHDENAVYLGLTQEFRQDGKTVQIAAVAASTLINGLPTTITYAEPYTGPDTFKPMLTETKRLTRDIVQSNEGAS
jgi:hypothetical protein